MRILIDCFKQVKGAGKSIGIYNVAVSMVQALTEERKRSADRQIRDAEIIVLGNPHNRSDLDIEGVRFIEIRKYDPLNRIHFTLWELELVALACKKLRADLVIYPRGYGSLTRSVKEMVMIHDLIPFHYDEKYPGYMNPVENTYIKNRLRASARAADRVMTDSEASRQDIIDRFGIPEEKVSVVWLTYRQMPFKDVEKKPYIVSITSALPHKNAPAVLESYRRYRARAKDPLDLVVIGIDDEQAKDLPEEVRSHVRCCRFVEKDEDLWQMIAEAQFMLFLSLMEGFGLPPLEAMNLGTPVVCSDRMSLPEVTGDAAILVDPDDTDRVAEEMERMTEDASLREELVRRGRKNLERFDMASRGREYWKVIAETLGIG